MTNDKTIEYQGKLIEITNNIKQLGTLEINTESYKLKVEEIKKDTDEQVKEEYGTYDKSENSIFLHDILSSIYEKSIERLNKINDHIVSEYEIYYKIDGKRKEIRNKIDNLDTSKINELIKETKSLLKSIKSSTTIAYEEEQKLVEDIYKIVYEVIKIEIIYNQKDTLLEEIKTDQTDTCFISKLINDEVKEILKEKDNKELIKKLNEINKKGFDDIHFLDRELIIIIATNNDTKLLKQIRNDFITTLDDYENKSFELQQVIDNNQQTENDIIEIKKKNKTLSLKRLGKKIIFLLNIALVGIGITGSIKFAKELTKKTVYKTYKSVYDTSLEVNDEPTEEYLPATENSVSLVEYTPWQEPGLFRDKYERTIYTYNLNQVTEFYENPEDYLNPELKDLITYTSVPDYSNEKPNDDYQENKYVIKHTYQDRSVYNDIYNPGAYIPIIVVLTLGILIIDIPIFKNLTKKNLKLERKNNKNLIEQNKRLLLENKNQLISLQDELKKAKENLNKQYEELPKQIREDEKIKEKMLVLDSNQHD